MRKRRRSKATVVEVVSDNVGTKRTQIGTQVVWVSAIYLLLHAVVVLRKAQVVWVVGERETILLPNQNKDGFASSSCIIVTLDHSLSWFSSMD